MPQEISFQNSNIEKKITELEEKIRSIEYQLDGLSKDFNSITGKVKEEEKKKQFEATKEKFSNLIDDLGFLEVVSSIPSTKPIHSLKRFLIYVSGGTKRLYIWDAKNNSWYYCSLT
jgi:seryl-tRNA synthetase